jgi:transposase
MVMVGVDVHKKTHTAVAVDEVGRELGQRTVRATDAGHRELVRWVRRSWPDERVEFAVEDCRHVSTRLERALLTAAMPVLRVPPKLMAGARDSARTRGKSDPIDALAVARAALREPNLPVAEHDEISREIKLLVDHREDLVNQRTQMIGRLTANPSRFRSEACFAMHAGVAPIPASSGMTSRHRLARGGNRQLNVALHRIAVTQIRLNGDGKTYYDKRRAGGDTTMEALRALKRRLARVVFNRLNPSDAATGACIPAAA